ncbi:intradiol ring-cleavage dioxygenase [Pelomonas sp. SE-A7]|uniref:dioxygenase family protein n=1 Tax=Pelomonas sp. SE-A7 TaxID=3054953 RepID=UPI00259D1766|nr:intradiol ring-cleavage dioxygenase [Pelomonas sp. SE-A7]MDM4764642.1 intradiol ring-cleavage dioxygenase [Pelomonas sp. SE-A7]
MSVLLRQHRLNDRRQLLQLTAGTLVLGAVPALAAANEDVPETEANWEGPFYKAGAPLRSLLLEPGMAGTVLTLNGRVLDVHGQALKRALLDFWQCDSQGVYDQAGYRLRGRMETDEQGRFQLRTIKPVAYGLGSARRPAHLHVKVNAVGGPVITTQLYFRGDPELRADAEAKPSLVLAPQRLGSELIARYDFVVRTG